MDAGEWLDTTGWRCHTSLVLAAVWVTWAGVGWVGSATALLLDAAGKPGGDWAQQSQEPLSTSDKAYTMFFAGIAGTFSGLLLGRISDRFGRVVALQGGVIACACVTFGFVFVRSKAGLRLILIATPFLASVSLVPLAKWIPAPSRGTYLTLTHAFWSVGRFAITCWWQYVPPDRAWTDFCVGVWAVAIALAAGWASLGWRLESPRWCVSHGDSDRAVSLLRQLGPVHSGIFVAAAAKQRSPPARGFALLPLLPRDWGHVSAARLRGGSVAGVADHLAGSRSRHVTARLQAAVTCGSSPGARVVPARRSAALLLGPVARVAAILANRPPGAAVAGGPTAMGLVDFSRREGSRAACGACT